MSLSASFRSEWPQRIASAIVILVTMLAAVFGGGISFVIIIGAVCVVALHEWHRLIEGGKSTREVVLSSLSVITALLLTQQRQAWIWPFAALAAGMVLCGASAALRKSSVFWHALGPLYVGLGALCLVALRADVLRGGWMVVGIFIAIWLADTGALLAGRAIGGPKLAPTLSPNKTWAGFVGGVAAASIAEAIYVAFLGGSVFTAIQFGIILALVGHSGDLFESSVKRRFHAKNSGDIIPGHGGMLDRIDSLLFASPVAAGLIFFAGFDQLFRLPV